MKIKEHSVVRATANIPSEKVAIGMEGTIVGIAGNDMAYAVEFILPDGESIVVNMLFYQIELVE